MSKSQAHKKPRKMNYNRACVDVPSKECAATHKALALPEILQEIFQHLDVQSKGRAAQVSWTWHDCIKQPQLWRGVTVALHYNKDDPSNIMIVPKEHFTYWTRGNGMTAIQPSWWLFPIITDLVVRVISTDKTISFIGQQFRNLVSLNLKWFYLKLGISDVAMTVIVENLKSLKHLNLGCCSEITDDGLAILCDGDVPTLHSLILARNDKLTSRALMFLGQGQTALQILKITYCDNIAHSGLQFLIQLTNLKVLKLKGCFGIRDDGMIHLAQMVNLAELNLSQTLIGRDGLELLAASGDSRLRSLKLKGCPRMFDSCGQPLASLTHLTKLDLSHTRIRDKVLQYLAEGAGSSNITTLDLILCHKLTDEAGRHLAKMVNLREVNLAYTKVGDVGLYHLTNAGDSNIEILTLTKSEALTDVGLTHVARLPRLHKLNVTRNHNHMLSTTA